MAIKFTDDFEEEDLTDFDGGLVGGEDLAANAISAMVGSFGLDVTLDDANDHYGVNTLSIGTNDVRFRFYIDTTPMAMTDGDAFTIQTINSDGTYGGVTYFSLVLLYFNDPNLQIRLAYNDDTNDLVYGALTTISDGEHYIEMHIHRETSDGDADGTVEIWIDGVSKDSYSDVDNWNIFPTINQTRFGVDNNDVAQEAYPL